MAILENIINDLKAFGSIEKAKHLQRFFKTGVGQYAQGDIFWGLTVPLIRKTAKTYKNLNLAQIGKLLEHEVHEVRTPSLP